MHKKIDGAQWRNIQMSVASQTALLLKIELIFECRFIVLHCSRTNDIPRIFDSNISPLNADIIEFRWKSALCALQIMIYKFITRKSGGGHP